MIRPATILFVLLGLALLGRLDRDGLIARTEVAARALGYEVRVEMKIQRARPAPAVACPAPGQVAPQDTVERRVPCE